MYVVLWNVYAETTEQNVTSNETWRLVLFFNAHRLLTHVFHFGLQKLKNYLLLKFNLKKK